MRIIPQKTKWQRPLRASRGGFAVFEAVLAIGLCGIMATAFVVAIQQVTKLSFEAKRESALSRIIHNELMFAATKPQIQEGKVIRQVEEWDVELETIISPIEDLVSEEGIALTDLLKIQVNAVWWADGDYQTRNAETWRHKSMYAR